mgnify:CR=1 FL=1
MFKHILTKKKTICILSGILLILIVWTAWGNTALELNTYTISSRGLPDAFDGYRIAQVSDLHNAEFGADNERLLEALRQACAVLEHKTIVGKAQLDHDLAEAMKLWLLLRKQYESHLATMSPVIMKREFRNIGN